MPEKSAGDPDTTLITVPNIPFWTGVHKGQKKGGYAKGLAYGVVNDNGLAEPFIQGKAFVLRFLTTRWPLVVFVVIEYKKNQGNTDFLDYKIRNFSQFLNCSNDTGSPQLVRFFGGKTKPH